MEETDAFRQGERELTILTRASKFDQKKTWRSQARREEETVEVEVVTKTRKKAETPRKKEGVGTSGGREKGDDKAAKVKATVAKQSEPRGRRRKRRWPPKLPVAWA